MLSLEHHVMYNHISNVIRPYQARRKPVNARVFHALRRLARRSVASLRLRSDSRLLVLVTRCETDDSVCGRDFPASERGERQRLARRDEGDRRNSPSVFLLVEALSDVTGDTDDDVRLDSAEGED